MELLIRRIHRCYKQLLKSRAHPPERGIFIEGYRCRLDELLLYYSSIRGISFCEVCKELNIPYADVNVLTDESGGKS